VPSRDRLRAVDGRSGELHPSDDPGAGNGPPPPAVDGLRSIVPKDVPSARRDDDRRWEILVESLVAGFDLPGALGDAVADHEAARDCDDIAFTGDDPLDVGLGAWTGLRVSARRPACRRVGLNRRCLNGAWKRMTSPISGTELS
jgi:hypothetical protein